MLLGHKLFFFQIILCFQLLSLWDFKKKEILKTPRKKIILKAPKTPRNYSKWGYLRHQRCLLQLLKQPKVQTHQGYPWCQGYPLQVNSLQEEKVKSLKASKSSWILLIFWNSVFHIWKYWAWFFFPYFRFLVNILTP